MLLFEIFSFLNSTVSLNLFGGFIKIMQELVAILEDSLWEILNEAFLRFFERFKDSTRCLAFTSF